MDKAVSVIVPVYNGENTIKRCIESILSQTLSDIEVIIVNDGSEDSTLSIAESITDGRIRVVSQENRGQGFARNRGIEMAGGKYIAFVDSDDTIETGMLEVMYRRGEETGADVVQCNLYNIYPDGRKTVQLDIEDEAVTISDKGEYTDKYFTPCRHSYEVCNKLIRKSVIDNSGIKFRDTRKYFSEDLLFNLELLDYIKKIDFVKEPYYNYYQNENSHLHKNSEKRLKGVCRLFDMYIAHADEVMKSAASYTAAMIIIYNAGFCTETEIAARVLSGDELKRYISAALKRRCKMSHRLFLVAMSFSPLALKKTLAKKYSGRWQL